MSVISGPGQLSRQDLVSSRFDLPFSKLTLAKDKQQSYLNKQTPTVEKISTARFIELQRFDDSESSEDNFDQNRSLMSYQSR